MIIVPISGDTITTKEGGKFTVSGFNNYKEKGPAVFCHQTLMNDDGTPALNVITIYFFDIAEINGVHVEFKRDTKTFMARGKISRSVHLPQPNDSVILTNHHIQEKVLVKGYRFRKRQDETHKGLQLVDEDGNIHDLNDVIDIERGHGSSVDFSVAKFRKLYGEYFSERIK